MFQQNFLSSWTVQLTQLAPYISAPCSGVLSTLVDQMEQKRFVQLRNSYLKDPNFNKENVLKVSEAAASIYTWVIAIDSF